MSTYSSYFFIEMFIFYNKLPFHPYIFIHVIFHFLGYNIASYGI